MTQPPTAGPVTGRSDRPLESELPRDLASKTGKIVVELPSLEALFDPTGSTTYPHSESAVERSVADFLVRAMRARRGEAEPEVEVVLPEPRRTTAEEGVARARFHRFFEVEEEMASLDIQVNRTEGLGALRYSVPFVLLAGVVAGLLSTTTTVQEGGATPLTLVYLAFLTVVWVMLWDPIEMLLFDSYILRLKRRALRKLASGRLMFVYRGGAIAGAGAEPGRSP